MSKAQRSKAIRRDRKARQPLGRNEIVGYCCGCNATILRIALSKGGAIRLGDKYLCNLCESGDTDA